MDLETQFNEEEDTSLSSIDSLEDTNNTSSLSSSSDDSESEESSTSSNNNDNSDHASNSMTLHSSSPRSILILRNPKGELSKPASPDRHVRWNLPKECDDKMSSSPTNVYLSLSELQSRGLYRTNNSNRKGGNKKKKGGKKNTKKK